MTMTLVQVETFPYGNLDKYTDLGDNHWYMLTACAEGCSGTGAHGIIQPHWKNGRWCGGGCTFKGHGDYAHWSVLQLHPLSLDPSFLCRGCGDHGFIRNGRWDSA